MNNIIVSFVSAIHLLTILFMIGVPFSNSNYFQLLHSIIVPFIILHWYINDDSCILTTIEKEYRGDNIKCFTCRLIEPVYNFVGDNDRFSKLIYLITILLVLMSMYKLLYKYKSGKIDNFVDIFTL